MTLAEMARIRLDEIDASAGGWACPASGDAAPVNMKSVKLSEAPDAVSPDKMNGRHRPASLREPVVT